MKQAFPAAHRLTITTRDGRDTIKCTCSRGKDHEERHGST